MIEAFLVAWIGVCAAQASPGPNLLAVAQTALASGRKASLLVVVGIACGSTVWAAATAWGLGALFTAVPALLTGLKLIGGAYLVFLAMRALRSAGNGIGPDAPESGSLAETGFLAWRRGLVVVMTNPKAALMWSAVATFLFGHGLSSLQVLAFGPPAAASALAIYGGYALLFSTGAATRVYRSSGRWFEATFGLIFGGLGLSLIYSAIQDLRS